MTPKQLRFIEEMKAPGISAAEAAANAGYSTKYAKQEARRLMNNPDVRREIDRNRAETAADADKSREWVAKEADISRAWVLSRLKQNAERCLAPGKGNNPGAANRALELLGKEIGMFVDRRLLGIRRIGDMSEDELLELLGGEPEPDELSAAASVTEVGHA